MIYFINHYINKYSEKLIYLFYKNVKLAGTFIIKATKMQHCGIRNGGRGHELGNKLSLIGLKALNHHYINKYMHILLKTCIKMSVIA